MLSAADKLRAELGEPEKKSTPAPKSGTRPVAGDGLFTKANAVDTMRVLDHLGIEHSASNRGEMAVCPGCGEDGALVCSGGGLKCLHDRCAGAGPKGNPGFRSNVDLVAHVQQVDNVGAAKTICGWFGIELPQPKSAPEHEYFNEEPPEWLADPEVVAGAEARAKKDIESGKSALEVFGVVDLKALLDNVVKVVKEGGPQRGYTTGIHDLDLCINGLRHGHITVLGAGTSYGKSSIGIMIADENLRLEVPVLVISVEDSLEMYGKRMMARRAGVNALRLRNNACDDGDIAKMERAAARATAIPFFMNGIGKSVEWCAEGIRVLCKKHKVRLVVCDYIQRFATTQHSQDRRNQVTYIAATLSDAIKESNAAGVLLSQLKRIEGREPTMDDLKESGDLENMAEHVVLGWRDKSSGKPYYEGEARPWRRFIKVPKNKDGPTIDDPMELKFNEITASFESTTQGQTDYTPQEDFGNYGYGAYP